VKNILVLIFLVLLIVFMLPTDVYYSQEESKPVIYRPSFEKIIRPIFVNNCSGCHRLGSSLPLILDYSVAHAYRVKIKEKLLTKGLPSLNRITEAEKEEVLLWVDTGALK